MACDSAAPADWGQLTKQLNKKADYFKAVDAAANACKRLQGADSAAEAAAAATTAAATTTATATAATTAATTADPAFHNFVKRLIAVLRARYTSRPFWVAGRQLLLAAQQAVSSSDDGAFVAQLAQWVAECNTFLGDQDEAEGSSSGGVSGSVPAGNGGSRNSSGFLCEGQLSEQEQTPPRPPGLLDLLGQQFAAAAAAAAAAQRAGAQGDAAQGGGQGGGGTDGQQQEQQGQQEHQEPSPEVLEAIERELDAIAVQIMEETGQAATAQRAAPPASKNAVASLPVEKLSAERLQQLGGAGARCPVCMEELSEGDEVQVMPCSSGHVFHPPCLAPWLEQNNSCPTCRHELPTDDQQYERRKEREKEEAEERRGAENALSHNEFMWI